MNYFLRWVKFIHAWSLSDVGSGIFFPIFYGRLFDEPWGRQDLSFFFKMATI